MALNLKLLMPLELKSMATMFPFRGGLLGSRIVQGECCVHQVYLNAEVKEALAMPDLIPESLLEAGRALV